jgi:phosphatidate cytidylyltransferase
VIQRILAAAVGLLIVVPLIVFGGNLGVDLLVGFVVLVCVDEWTRMATPTFRVPSLLALAVAASVVYGTLVWAPPAAVAPVLGVSVVGLLGFALLRVPETDAAAKVGVRLVAGLCYTAVLLSYLPAVRRFDDGVAWIFLILAGTWMCDTGAYFAGRAFGRRKLFERVSPKKTWEGAIGGMFASVGGTVAVQQLALPDLSWVHAAILGGILAWVGVVGDLVESMFKRSFGVKDSGWIMPGHGGLLDRVDALLFTAPVAYAYARLFGLG